MSTKRTSNLEIEKTKKRARKAVTLETKLNVLRRLENGEKITYIYTALGFPKSTVQTIRNNKRKSSHILSQLKPLTVLNGPVKEVALWSRWKDY